MIDFIVSGGQTGADRAALDVALALSIPHGGWCPQGRRAEDGRIPEHYQLIETPSSDYRQRTEWNVRDSDGTLILLLEGRWTSGSRLTCQWAHRLGRPYHIVALPHNDERLLHANEWLNLTGAVRINVAGSRESVAPGIHALAYRFLLQFLQHHNRLVGS